MADRLSIVVGLLTLAWMGGGLWLAIVMPATPAQREGWQAIYIGVLIALGLLAWAVNGGGDAY